MLIALTLIPLLLIVILLAATTIFWRKQGYSGPGGETIVRCRAGHVFTTIWIPGASFKAVRLGWKRFQQCPVGNHWTLVAPVKESELTSDELHMAAQFRDVRVP